jgi:ubiquinone/menaquinone biosynthesis C-methylase UbiE
VRFQDSNVELDTEKLKKFFQGRKSRYSTEDALTAVLYQDNNRELAKARHSNELEKIFPLLNLRPNSHVLDIGCGVGRWAEQIKDLASAYVGTDFSSELIEIAKNRFGTHPNLEFFELSAEETSFSNLSRTFDTVIIGGLFLYLNSEQIEKVLNNLAGLIPQGRFYLREPIGLNEKLTLVDEWSDELQDFYNAIYRKEDEIVDLVENSLLGPRMKLFKTDWMTDASLQNRSETSQKFWIWEIENA